MQSSSPFHFFTDVLLWLSPSRRFHPNGGSPKRADVETHFLPPRDFSPMSLKMLPPIVSEPLDKFAPLWRGCGRGCFCLVSLR